MWGIINKVCQCHCLATHNRCHKTRLVLFSYFSGLNNRSKKRYVGFWSFFITQSEVLAAYLINIIMFNGVFLTNVLSSIFIFGTAMSTSVINSIDFTLVFMNFFYRNRMHNLYVYATTNKDTLHEYKIETPPISNIVEISPVLQRISHVD